MFFCRHPEAVHGAFDSAISFMPAATNGGASDPYVNSTQWSRRFTGLKLFLSLATLGKSGYAAAIDRQAHLAVALRQALQATGWRIVNSTPLPVVCFTRDGLDAATFVPKVQQRQIAWISQVTLDKHAPVLRACITSIRTTDQHIRDIVDQMNTIFLEESAPVDSLGCANAA